VQQRMQQIKLLAW